MQGGRFHWGGRQSAELQGVGVWSRLIPNVLGVTFYNQVFVLDPGVNGLGLISSNAGEGVVGS